MSWWMILDTAGAVVAASVESAAQPDAAVYASKSAANCWALRLALVRDFDAGAKLTPSTLLKVVHEHG